MRTLSGALALACLACAAGAPVQESQSSAPSIRGVVLGPEGHAVPGVLVATTHPESGLWRDLLDADSISAETGLDGRFELRGLAAGKWRVAAYARECPQGEGTSVELHAGERLEELVVPLLRPASAAKPLRVHVLDPQGQPVRFASVVCTPRPGCEYGNFARPDAEHAIFEIPRMPGERISLRAAQEQLPRARATGLLAPAYAFDVPAEKDELELRLTALPAHTLLVVDENEQPVRSFSWQALDEHQFRRRETGGIQRNAFGLAIDSFRAGPTPAEHWQRWALVDAQHSGNRDLEQIPQPVGPFLVQVFAIGFEPAECGPFEGANSPAEIRVVLRRAPEVRGVVVATGEPVAGAVVRLLYPHAPVDDSRYANWPENVLPGFEELYDERARATTSPDGSFTLVRSEAGRCLLRAGIDSAAEVEAGPFDFGLHDSLTGLRIELPHRGSIEGRIKTRPGREIVGKFVLATRNLGRDPLVAKIEADGAFRFAQLAPGRWTLRESSYDPSKSDGCRIQEPDRRPAETDPLTCEVRADETAHVEIDLTRPVRFTARVELPGYERSELTLQMWGSGSTFGEGRHGMTREPGNEVTVELDQPGEYQLTLELHRFPFFEHLEVQEKVVLHEGENTWYLRGTTSNLRVQDTRSLVNRCITLRDGPARLLRLALHFGQSGECLVENVPLGFWSSERREWNDPIIPDVVTVEPGKTAELVLH